MVCVVQVPLISHTKGALSPGKTEKKLLFVKNVMHIKLTAGSLVIITVI